MWKSFKFSLCPGAFYILIWRYTSNQMITIKPIWIICDDNFFIFICYITNKNLWILKKFRNTWSVHQIGFVIKEPSIKIYFVAMKGFAIEKSFRITYRLLRNYICFFK